MKTLIIFLWILTLLFSSVCYGQDINWIKTTHWKLYNIHDKAAFNYSVDTLQYFKNTPLDDSTMHHFLKPVSLWPVEKYSLWMGLFVASFETEDKRLQKIIISFYGGFFYDPLTKRYYELPEDERKAWYQYINDSAEKIVDK